MLSDEEKKAIEIVKGITEDDLLDYWEGPEEPYNAIQIVLNLIEKQSKEIEELKVADLTTVYLNGFYDGEKKVKDKIKAKIEELNKDFKEYENGQEWEIQDEIRGQIDVLQSLLEKE